MLRLSGVYKKPNRSPAKRVRFGEEEQRRERALTFEKVGASDTELAPTWQMALIVIQMNSLLR